MAIAKEVTFEGLKYTLDNQDRLAATVAHQSAGNQVPVESITGAATPTLTMADSGKTYLLTASGGSNTIAFTLPAVEVSAGFHACFIVKATSNKDISWTSGADNMIVSTTEFTNSGAAQSHVTDTCTTLTINADTVNAVVGDKVEIWCDGTNYFIKGFSNTQSNTAIFVAS